MSNRSERRRQERTTSGGTQPRRDYLTWIIGGLAVVAIAIFAITQSNKLVPGTSTISPNSVPSIPPARAVGTKAPPFSVMTPHGPLSNDSFAGKPYMLELFATWCPHCQRMTKVLRSIRAQIPESRFEMLAVNGSPFSAESTPGNIVPESQRDIDQFDKFYQVTWLSAFDPQLATVKAYGLTGFPQFFIVDRKGVIRFNGSGEMSEATLMKAIKAAGGT